MTIIYEICTHSSLYGTKWEKRIMSMLWNEVKIKNIEL